MALGPEGPTDVSRLPATSASVAMGRPANSSASSRLGVRQVGQGQHAGVLPGRPRPRPARAAAHRIGPRRPGPPPSGKSLSGKPVRHGFDDGGRKKHAGFGGPDRKILPHHPQLLGHETRRRSLDGRATVRVFWAVRAVMTDKAVAALHHDGLEVGLNAGPPAGVRTGHWSVRMAVAWTPPPGTGPRPAPLRFCPDLAQIQAAFGQDQKSPVTVTGIYWTIWSTRPAARACSRSTAEKSQGKNHRRLEHAQAHRARTAWPCPRRKSRRQPRHGSRSRCKSATHSSTKKAEAA